jgi:hypothetical protein
MARPDCGLRRRRAVAWGGRERRRAADGHVKAIDGRGRAPTARVVASSPPEPCLPVRLQILAGSRLEAAAYRESGGAVSWEAGAALAVAGSRGEIEWGME